MQAHIPVNRSLFKRCLGIDVGGYRGVQPQQRGGRYRGIDLGIGGGTEVLAFIQAIDRRPIQRRHRDPPMRAAGAGVGGNQSRDLPAQWCFDTGERRVWIGSRTGLGTL